MNDPFPRISDLIKLKTQQLSEAEWNDDNIQQLILKIEIESLNRMLSYGEEFIVPF